jgi:spore coat protein SA
MKIAAIIPGVLPVPAVKGGAVETLIDYILEYNECNLTHEITVFGIDDNDLADYNFKQYNKTFFELLKLKSLTYRLKRKLYSFSIKSHYYNSFLDFFVDVIGKKISKMQFDVIIVENRPGFVLSLSQYTNAKIILHLHNDTLNKNTENAKEILERCTNVLTVSNYIKKQVDTIMPTDKVHVVYNGIDLDMFKRLPCLSINRNRFNLSENDFIVVYIGRIEPVKGVKELLEAISLLYDYKKIKLLIVGGGNGNVNSGEFFLEMQKIARSMSDKVVFTGFQSYNDIPSILHFCDVAVVPSIWEEPLSLTSLESMAVGLPLVVTRSGGLPEAVDDKCAIILENDSYLAQNIAKNILVLYNNQKQKEEMSKHARERSALFSKEKYCESFFYFLNKL